MDWYPVIPKEAIIDYNGKNKDINQRYSVAWLNFTWLAALISKGCGRIVEAWIEHGVELDAAGKDVMTSFIAPTTREACRSPYLHGLAYHLGDLVR
jgi:hypothetical protein